MMEPLGRVELTNLEGKKRLNKGEEGLGQESRMSTLSKHFSRGPNMAKNSLKREGVTKPEFELSRKCRSKCSS